MDTKVISFYPGPSQLRPHLDKYLRKGFASGILAANHRSQVFMEMAAKTIQMVKIKLAIPEEYHVIFAGSATEHWETLAQSLPQHHSHHFYNGAFGEKWHQRASNIKGEALSHALPFGLEALPQLDLLPKSSDMDLICFTQNETSNGTQVPSSHIARCKAEHPEALLAVDATSSMAGIALDWQQADFWYASVQKCFGLPAGLSVMVISPKGKEAVAQHDPKLHYNSLAIYLAQIQHYQTPYTPNVMGIYLLGRVMENARHIQEEDAHIRQRAEQARSKLASYGFGVLSSHAANQSDTVLAVKAPQNQLAPLFAKAAEYDLIIGKGYAPWHESSFRLANFPAVPDRGFDNLWQLLQEIV